MTTIVLSIKAAKLMTLCDKEGFETLDQLLRFAAGDSLCPAICMADGCDLTTETNPGQRSGYCEGCGGNTIVSVLVLVDSFGRRR